MKNKIYSDASVFKDTRGWAYVLYYQGFQIIEASWHNSRKGINGLETYAIHQALRYLSTNKITIFTDSQHAIRVYRERGYKIKYTNKHSHNHSLVHNLARKVAKQQTWYCRITQL